MDLAQALTQFHGTERYYRHWCGVEIYLTDGAKYLAEQAQAYWLMDLIASAQPYYRHDEFVVVQLKKQGSSAVVTIAHDTGAPPYYTQHIPYTDFPLETLTLFAALGAVEADPSPRYVVLLPSEH